MCVIVVVWLGIRSTGFLYECVREREREIAKEWERTWKYTECVRSHVVCLFFVVSISVAGWSICRTIWFCLIINLIVYNGTLMRYTSNMSVSVSACASVCVLNNLMFFPSVFVFLLIAKCTMVVIFFCFFFTLLLLVSGEFEKYWL